MVCLTRFPLGTPGLIPVSMIWHRNIIANRSLLAYRTLEGGPPKMPCTSLYTIHLSHKVREILETPAPECTCAQASLCAPPMRKPASRHACASIPPDLCVLGMLPVVCVKFFRRWVDALKWSRMNALKRFALLVGEHLDEILSYCEKKMSLGDLASTNQKAKNVIRRAHG